MHLIVTTPVMLQRKISNFHFQNLCQPKEVFGLNFTIKKNFTDTLTYSLNVALSWTKLLEARITLNLDSSVPHFFSPACEWSNAEWIKHHFSLKFSENILHKIMYALLNWKIKIKIKSKYLFSDDLFCFALFFLHFWK